MKSKLIVRIVCIILAVLLVGSVFAMIIPYIAHAAGMEGYIHSDNVEVDGFEPPVPEEEDEDF